MIRVISPEFMSLYAPSKNIMTQLISHSTFIDISHTRPRNFGSPSSNHILIIGGVVCVIGHLRQVSHTKNNLTGICTTAIIVVTANCTIIPRKTTVLIGVG
jgi:hypothetical protein